MAGVLFTPKRSLVRSQYRPRRSEARSEFNGPGLRRCTATKYSYGLETASRHAGRLRRHPRSGAGVDVQSCRLEGKVVGCSLDGMCPCEVIGARRALDHARRTAGRGQRGLVVATVRHNDVLMGAGWPGTSLAGPGLLPGTEGERWNQARRSPRAVWWWSGTRSGSSRRASRPERAGR
jgi:hypothetical protein